MAGWWRSYIAQRARQMGLDPRAVLAVAAQEGLNSRGGWSGRQSDNGTSFGPFQLHRGGALPAGRDQQWAESRQGIDYALAQINRVAHGERGRQAVSDIVSRFERPANPGGEIARALAAYGGGGGGGAAPGPAASPTASLTRSLQAPGQQGSAAPPDLSGLRSGLAQSLIAASQQSSAGRRPDYTSVTQALLALHQGQMSPGLPTQQPGTLAPSPAGSGASGGGAPGVGPPTGGPSLSFLTPLASRFGLQITSTTGGKHAPGSYHYQSRAEDYGGDPAHEARLQRYALAHPTEFKEVFYTGPGAAPYFVKDGKVRPITQLDPGLRAEHRNHVHLAR